MQAARLSYATDTRFIAIFLDAVAGKSPLKQRAKENLIVGVFDASPGRMDLSYGFFFAVAIGGKPTSPGLLPARPGGV
jgi:hypothetical protein